MSEPTGGTTYLYDNEGTRHIVNVDDWEPGTEITETVPVCGESLMGATITGRTGDKCWKCESIS